MECSLNKKFELLKDDYVVSSSGKKLYRIKALRTFGKNEHSVKKGELGGYIV